MYARRPRNLPGIGLGHYSELHRFQRWSKKLAIDSVKRRFEEVPLSWVFRVKEGEKLVRNESNFVQKINYCQRWLLVVKINNCWSNNFHTSMTNLWSMYFLARLGWKSEDSRHLQGNDSGNNAIVTAAPEEEFVDQLQVRPSCLQRWLVLFRVKLSTLGERSFSCVKFVYRTITRMEL